MLINSLIFFLIAVGILVMWHELGHYFAARACGVSVQQFSIGFGPPLWSRKFFGTEWRLSAIPLGGYVKLVDEREGNVKVEDIPYAFNRKPLWQRNLILAAGSMANFLLAWIGYTMIFVIGSDQPRPIFAEPAADTIAMKSGVHSGDEVLRAAGQEIMSWQELRWSIFSAALYKKDLPLTVRDVNGQEQTHILEFSQYPFNRDWGAGFMDQLGLSLKLPPLLPIIGEVRDGPGKVAGIMAGDVVLSINQVPIHDWRQMVEMVRQAANRPLVFEIERDKRKQSLIVTPHIQDGRSMIGVGVAEQKMDPIPSVNVKYSLPAAMAQAWREMGRTLWLSLNMLGKMFTNEVSVRNLNGPVAIAQYAGQSAEQGFVPYIHFLAFISLSLGMVNLFPIPLLDGGHLLFNFIEWVRGGKSLTEKSMVIGQKLGLVVLVALMLVALYNDLSHFVAF